MLNFNKSRSEERDKRISLNVTRFAYKDRIVVNFFGKRGLPLITINPARWFGALLLDFSNGERGETLLSARESEATKNNHDFPASRKFSPLTFSFLHTLARPLATRKDAHPRVHTRKTKLSPSQLFVLVLVFFFLHSLSSFSATNFPVLD